MKQEAIWVRVALLTAVMKAAKGRTGLFWLTAQGNTVHHSSEAQQQEGEGGVVSICSQEAERNESGRPAPCSLESLCAVQHRSPWITSYLQPVFCPD